VTRKKDENLFEGDDQDKARDGDRDEDRGENRKDRMKTGTDRPDNPENDVKGEQGDTAGKPTAGVTIPAEGIPENPPQESDAIHAMYGDTDTQPDDPGEKPTGAWVAWPPESPGLAPTGTPGLPVPAAPAPANTSPAPPTTPGAPVQDWALVYTAPVPHEDAEQRDRFATGEQMTEHADDK
jgi:hypothetical protein